MGSIDWTITIIIVVPLALSSLIIELADKKVRLLRSRSRMQGSAVTEFIGEFYNSSILFNLAPQERV